MENKTAVEWLVEQYEEKVGTLLLLTFKEFMKNEIQQALEIEKQQIIDAKDCWFKDERDGDEYYLETFKPTT